MKLVLRGTEDPVQSRDGLVAVSTPKFAHIIRRCRLAWHRGPAVACWRFADVRVLLVEDSRRLRESVARGLRKCGYAVDEVDEGSKALMYGRSRDYDVMILDLLLPQMHGLTVLERLRAEKVPTQILILTALDRVEDRIRGLRLGADDYLVKPFAFDELVARTEALVRRRYGDRSPTTVIGKLQIDPARRHVACSGEELQLTGREYAILDYLARRQGSVVSRFELEEHVYEDRKPIESNAIDSAICLLRRKLGRSGCGEYIQTRRGLGYILEAPNLSEKDNR